MSKSRADQEIDLKELAERLTLEGMPAQTIVAREAGVSQSTVSRAMRRQIKGVSKGARKLWKYTSDRIRILHETSAERPAAMSAAPPRSTRQRRVSRAQLAKGMNKRGEARERAAPLPRRRNRAAAPENHEERDHLAEVAIAGLRDYLADAFDPLLVIEQLAVLRRAQDPALRRRAETVSKEGIG